METIESLRKKGFKVRVLRERVFNGIYDGKLFRVNSFRAEYLSAKGGKTHIDITTPEGKTVSGESLCSVNDPFDRKLGNKIALGRALKQLIII